MGKRNRLLKRGQELELQIKDLVFGGKGIAKMETEDGDFAVFVPNTLPGQKVRAKVTKCKKNYAECKLMNVIEHSEEEIEIPYQIIPGAPYVKLPIQKQIDYKQKTTIELFEKIGKQQNVLELFDEFIPSPSPWHYRNKMEYSFSAIGYDTEKHHDVDEFSLGFKHRGTWWMVENLDEDSGIFDQEFESNLKRIRLFLIETGLPAWHPPRKEGFFRYIVVRKSFKTNQLLINLVTTSDGLEKFETDKFVDLLKSILGDRLAGVIHTLNDNIGDRVDSLDGSSSLLYGESKIVETINDLNFEISMSSFFQTNPKSAEKLYDKVLEYALVKEQNDGVIMDLFCGTGTIAQLLAKEASSKVIGVDIVESSIEDAKENARRNEVSNVEFYAADVGKFLFEYPEYINQISTIILDPPRAGISPKTLKKVIALNAKKMVYVSCNPATQARDTLLLQESGYTMKKLSLVDQFPHTSHVESIAVFEK